MNVGLFAQIACLWEATARKVGNVHGRRDRADLRFTDLLLSAASIGSAMAQASQRPVGETVLEAIQATRKVVSTNTNLGIVLLLAPLSAVTRATQLAEGLQRTLDALTVADSRHVYQAIRLAEPGGLGEVPKQDVHKDPSMPLRAVMALAAERDLVARQYTNGYIEVLAEGVPLLHRNLMREQELESAIILTHLHFLAHHADSLIVRKKGLDLAKEASSRARTALAASVKERPQALADLDAWLVAGGLNPGTSADLVTACLFVALREGIIKLPLEIPWSQTANSR